MRKKKSAFLTFIFSMIPGAGEMYMGFMKQGVSLMTVFFGALFLYSTIFYTFGFLLALLPVIWAYSFFHTHNLRSLPDEQFYAQEDKFLFNLEELVPKDGKLLSQYRKVFSVVLIFLGIALLWQSLSSMIRWVIPDSMRIYYNSFVNALPQIVIAAFMVWCGVWLIKGKKKELYSEENNQETIAPGESGNMGENAEAQKTIADETIKKEGENG